MSYETDCLGYWFQELLTDFVAVSAENATNCLDSVALVRSSEVIAEHREISHGLMHLPIFAEAVTFAHLARVAVAVGAVLPLDEHRVDPVTDQRTLQSLLDSSLGAVHHPRFDRHHPVVLPCLMHGRVGQVLGRNFDRLGLWTPLAL